MKKGIIYIIAIFIIGFTFPISDVSAQCSNSEKNKLALLAQNITTSYDYIEENGKVSFYITLSNLQPGFRVRDIAHGIDYYYTGEDIIIYNFVPNNNYRLDIYSTSCTERLYSHYISLPGYNPYYMDPICIEVNHSICQKWVNMKYDYDTFIKEVNKIKDKKPNKTPIEEKQEVLGFYDYIIDFFVKYYYIMLPLIIIVCSIAIYKLRRKDDLF